MNTSTNSRTAAILTAAAVAAGAALLATAPTAHAAVGFSNPSAAGGVPSEATVTATVQGAGDVYVEYAHARTTYPSVKDRYATDGLIAMWDGDDNQGTGAPSNASEKIRHAQPSRNQGSDSGG